LLAEPLAGTYRPFADTTSRHPVSRRTLAAAEKRIHLRSRPEVGLMTAVVSLRNVAKSYLRGKQ